MWEPEVVAATPPLPSAEVVGGLKLFDRCHARIHAKAAARSERAAEEEFESMTSAVARAGPVPVVRSSRWCLRVTEAGAATGKHPAKE